MSKENDERGRNDSEKPDGGYANLGVSSEIRRKTEEIFLSPMIKMY